MCVGSIIREDGLIETHSFTYNTKNQQVKVESEDGWVQGRGSPCIESIDFHSDRRADNNDN